MGPSNAASETVFGRREAAFRPARTRMSLVCLAVVGLTYGCGVHGLSFREDSRLEIVAPSDRAEVSLPVTIDWEISDFEVTGPNGSAQLDGGYFAVFVDRAPPPPGRSLEWLARDDETCVAARGCPDEEWFERHRIYTTTDTSFTVESLPSRSDDRRDFHEVTVVLLDGQRQRLGEGAWSVKFAVVRSR